MQLIMLITFVLVFLHTFVVTFSQRYPGNRLQNSCPRGTGCVPINRCNARVLNSMQSRVIQCGYTYNWVRRVCCPQRRSLSSMPQPWSPVPTPVRSPVRSPSWVTTTTTSRTPRLLPITGSTDSNAECGIQPTGRQALVIGGQVAKQGAWPWMVLITTLENGAQVPSCTGFLIDRSHFISAAHCFESRRTSLYRARIGHVDVNLGDEYGISNIEIPSGYRPGRFYDDIALVRLSRDVSAPDFRPVCLPDPGFRNLTGRGTTVVGWGATRSGGPMSDVLMELYGMPVVSNTRCEQIFRQRIRNFSNEFSDGIPPQMLCAAFLEQSGRDSCGGDSGGPLMIQENNRWIAVGVVSFGFDCGRPGFPGGYIRVSAYLDWINRNRNEI